MKVKGVYFPNSLVLMEFLQRKFEYSQDIIFNK